MKKLLSVLLLSALSASAAVIQFDLQGRAGPGLIGGNETGVLAGTPGSGGEIGGGIFFDDVSKILTINVGWGSGNGFTDLTGPATNSHIHGPADFNTAAGTVFGLTRADSTASGGFISVSTAALSAAQEAQLMGGLWYVNIHTATNGPGEIRGNMVVVPEPGMALFGALGLLGLVRRRR